MMFRFIFLIILNVAPLITAKKGVVIVPVADLVGNSVQKKVGCNPEKMYGALPLCGGSKNPLIACPRVHQLLYNETVEIIEECDHELRISVPNLYFITESNKKPHTHYWVLKKNIVSWDELAKHTMDCDKIPQPINSTNHMYPHNYPYRILIIRNNIDMKSIAFLHNYRYYNELCKAPVAQLDRAVDS